jgi:biopolymer transport protein TolR
MQAGNGGSHDEPITEINITPLVDVSLVLVIIFMVTMPFLMEKAMRVSASADKVVAVSSVKEPILVEIRGENVIVEGRQVALPELASRLQGLIKERQNGAVAVSAERGISHGRVVQVLDEAAASGATELNLLDPREKGNDHI